MTKKSAAYTKAMKMVAGISQTAKELGVTRPKARGKVSVGKKKKKNNRY